MNRPPLYTIIGGVVWFHVGLLIHEDVFPDDFHEHGEELREQMWAEYVVKGVSDEK